MDTLLMTPKNKALFLIVAVCIIFLMMSACAGLSVEERYELARECQVTQDQDCKELWADWNRGVEAQQRRDAQRKAPCDRGYVLYCDQWCTRGKLHREVAGVCVKKSAIGWY